MYFEKLESLRIDHDKTQTDYILNLKQNLYLLQSSVINKFIVSHIIMTAIYSPILN